MKSSELKKERIKIGLFSLFLSFYYGMGIKRGIGIRLLLLAWLMACAPMLRAQFYNGMNMPFGKNRVQWHDFHWSYYSNDNFDVYYYQGGDDFAKYAQQYAKTQIPMLESRLSSRFSKKIQFILFNNLADFKQSNLFTDDEERGNTGGITKIVGSKVVLYFDGDYTHFETQIREGIVQLLFSQIMNGTSVGSQLRNSYRYDIPEWFQNGLITYIANDWNSYKEEQLQRGIVTGDYKKINQLYGEDALIAGYSFWNFIGERYGSKAFNDILTLAQSSQNVRRALLYVTGKEFKDLTKDWYEFYKDRYGTLLSHRPENPMKLSYKKHRTFTQPSVSPDGKHIAYVSNDEGLIQLWLEDLQSGKKQRLFKTGYRSDEHVDTSYPLLAWHPNSQILSFIIEDKGKIQLFNLDIATGKKASTYLFEFQKITSFSYAHKSRKIVVAGTRRGKADIYVYNLFSNTLEQITNDYHTDLSPVFSHDDRQIIFSSNRNNDTIKDEKEVGFQNSQFDLYAYDYVSKSPLLQNLTRQKVTNSILPLTLKNGSILYLSDSTGFYNLCMAQLDSAISFIDTTIHYRYFAHTLQLTDYSANIIDYTYFPRDNKIAMLIGSKTGDKIYLSPNLSTMQGSQPRQMNPFAQKRIIEEARKAEEEVTPQAPKHKFVTSYRFSRRKANTSGTLFPDSIAAPPTNAVAEKPKKRDTILRPNNYYVELFADQLFTQIDFTSMSYSYQPFGGGGSPVFLNSNFNIFLGSTLKDLMEDYKVDLGVKLNTTLTNNEYVLRFSDLSKRVDKSLTLHRNVTDDYYYYYYRTVTNEAFYQLSYPFSEILSLRGTLIYRNDHRTNLAIDDYSLADKDTQENWGGLRGELVFDNSHKIGTNLYLGSRGKVFAEYYQLIGKGMNNMIVTGFDYRHYTRISRNFIWANRVAGSSSLGNNKLIYYMGGVDNWIGATFDNGTPIDFEQNYAYQTLATNMRGFKQNIRNGNNFMVINSELRFPVFSYFFNRPINMQFIKDFQLVAFGDIGTAWTGWNPYNLSNSLYTSHYQDGNLNISVTEMKEPIVGGVGLGLRTTLFGYFIRGDMAWGIQDGTISKKPQFYLSFNLDF